MGLERKVWEMKKEMKMKRKAVLGKRVWKENEDQRFESLVQKSCHHHRHHLRRHHRRCHLHS